MTIIVPSLRPCGPNNQLVILVKALNDLGYNVVLWVLFKTTEKESYTTELEQLCCRIEVGFRALLLIFARGKLITQGLIPDIISSFCFWRKSISFVRNVAWIDYPLKFGKLIGYPMAIIHITCMYWINIRIAVSDSIKDAYSRLNIDMMVIHNSVQSDDNTLSGPIDIDSMDCVSVGSLIERKGMLQLADYFHVNAKEQRLVIYGEGPNRPKLEKFDNVILKGYSDSLRQKLHEYSYFISNSRSEGYPNAVLEAAVSGLPLLLSDIGPHREIARNFKYAILFDSMDALPSAIDKLKSVVQNSTRNDLKNSAILAFGYDNYKVKIKKILDV